MTQRSCLVYLEIAKFVVHSCQNIALDLCASRNIFAFVYDKLMTLQHQMAIV